MWGSFFDATKELADKARKAAEELERNLNDSAGVVVVNTAAAAASAQPDRTEDLNEEDSTHHHNDDDGIVNDTNITTTNTNDDDDDDDAWDDDDIDIPDTDEPQTSAREGEINDTCNDNDNNLTSSSPPPPPPPPERLPDPDASVPSTCVPTMPDDPHHYNNNQDPTAVIDNDENLRHIPPEQEEVQPIDETAVIHQELVVTVNDVVDDDDIHHDNDDDTRIIRVAETTTTTEDPGTKVTDTPHTKDDDDDNTDVKTASIESPVEDHRGGALELVSSSSSSPVHSSAATDDRRNSNNTTEQPLCSLPHETFMNDQNDETPHNPALHIHPKKNDDDDDDDDVTPIPVSEMSTDHDLPKETRTTIVDDDDDDDAPPSSLVELPITTALDTRITVNDDDDGPPDYESQENVGERPTLDGTRHDDMSDQRNATTETIVPAPTSLVDDNNNNDDESKNLVSIIDKLLANEVARKMLEEKYSLTVTRDNEDKNAEVNGAGSIQQLQEELHQREQQLFSKTEQITMMEAMHETEKQDLLSKIQSTKDEAKRRIQKAKERVDAVELKLKNMTSQQTTSSAALEETIQQQTVLITELRKEGEKLAQKQADMELVVRASKTETRELRKQIDEMEEEANRLSEQLRLLEVDYKVAQEQLSSARQGISQVDQLDTELRAVREENEKRASTILTLEQAVKELRTTNKEMENELKVTRKGAALESEQERKRLIMEHGQIVSDMEMKLQASEREAAIREDALRVEIDDLRKRWQESVRRADTLSVDIQANTAPLLRQIDSINKQSRIRATAWAELETQLRNEIENSIVSHEKLTKECNEWKAKVGRLDRTNKEYEAEVKQLKSELYEQHDAVQKLQHQYDEALHEIKQLKASLSDMERLSNESVARVRSEITRKMVDSEEQYRIQIESLEQQLQEEQNLRSKVEVQLMEQQSYKNHNEGSSDNNNNDIDGSAMTLQPTSSKNDTDSQQRLRQSQDQAEILVGALGGIVGSEYDDEDTTNDGERDTPTTSNGPMNSYAALEELTSRLKASKMELGTLRTRLVESEKIRNELLVMVDEARVAREQLPLVEQRVQELTTENHELQLEIQGLKDDIADVRELYRTQLNVLLEAQAASDKAGNDEQNVDAL